MDFFDLLALLVIPEAVAGALCGLVGAWLIHRYGQPDPVLVEAGVVAFGFVMGLCLAKLDQGRRDSDAGD